MKNLIKHSLVVFTKTMLLLYAVIFFNACRKADNTTQLAGTYTGKFIYASNLGVFYNHGVQAVSFTFTGNNYSANYNSANPTANSISGIATGNFSLKKDSVTFNPDAIVPGTLQGSLTFLNGTYEYHYEADSLIITSNDKYAYNQYRLKKN